MKVMNESQTSPNYETIGGYKLRNLKLQIGPDCNCSLSKTLIIGEIFVGDSWHQTKWNLDGSNISGVERWRLNNIDATNIKAGNI